MISIKECPNNEEYAGLIKFGKDIIKMLHENKIRPILYGSMACLVYTKEANIKIKDIDFYIPENSFKKIMPILERRKIKYKYSPKWHTMQLMRSGLKIELDSMEYWYRRPLQTRKMDFNGITVDLLNLNGLKYIYKRAARVSDKPQKNLKKYKMLANI